LCISAPFIIAAQHNAILKKKDSYVLTDISYQNDAVYLGRFDSITSPYIVPSIGYYDASGFFCLLLSYL
jgi:hypothetical protein